MREIKFRGKRLDNGEWVYGDLRHWNNGEMGIVQNPIHQRSDSVCGYPVGSATVGQYTGLKDKNGREIYEGDIVRRGYDGTTGSFYNNMPVNYSVNYGGWLTGEYERLTPKTVIKENIEAIGNIHDNPDLLKEEA